MRSGHPADTPHGERRCSGRVNLDMVTVHSLNLVSGSGLERTPGALSDAGQMAGAVMLQLSLACRHSRDATRYHSPGYREIGKRCETDGRLGGCNAVGYT